MKWLGRRESDNIEDRRGVSGGGKIALGGGLVGVIFLIVKIFFGNGENAGMINAIENQVSNSQGQSGTETTRELTPEEKEVGKFVSVIFADCEDVWSAEFQKMNQDYTLPKMVLVSEDIQSPCGPVGTSSGPCYCPSDMKCYMDMNFFGDLQSKYGAKGGDFATAYVIAHEVGHHVQNMLGISEKVRKIQSGKSEAESNKLSVAMELQADFLAGMWAKKAQEKFNMLESGDLEEALSAAGAVGDDHIQGSNANKESFTHGTSKQRIYWFKKGFETGDINQGNTFENLNQ